MATTREDLGKVGVCVGAIIKAEDPPQAKSPTCKPLIDPSEFGIKKSSARIRGPDSKDGLVCRPSA